MRIIIMTILCLLSCTGAYSQLKSTSGNLWFERIGLEFSSVSGRTFTFPGTRGKFLNQNNGVLLQLVEEIHSTSYEIIAIRVSGLMFLSEHAAAKLSRSRTIESYWSPLPLALKFGMSPAEVKAILPACKMSPAATPGESFCVIGQLAGFSDLDVYPTFHNNRLSSLFIEWNGGDVGATFRRPERMLFYDVKQAMEDQVKVDVLLSTGSIYQYLNSVIAFWHSSLKMPAMLSADKSKVITENGESRRVSTFCTDKLNFKYSFYMRLETTLSWFLDDCIVKKSAANYKVLNAYQRDKIYVDPKEYWGEAFYFHEEDAKTYKKKNKWPVFHCYTLAGSNEVVLEVIAPNADEEDKVSSVIPRLKGNDWLSYIDRSETTTEVKSLIRYLKSFLPPDSYDFKTDGSFDVDSLGIEVFMGMIDYDEKNQPQVIGGFLFLSNFAGELPLGFSFDQTFLDLRSQGKLQKDNSLRIYKNNEIRISIRFDEKGKMKSFYFDHFNPQGREKKWETVIRNLDCSYHDMPTLERGSEKNRFEKKFQRVCTPDDRSMVMNRAAYIQSLGLDLSARIDPNVANVRDGELLSAIGKPTESGSAKILIRKLGAYKDHPITNDFGTLNFENATIAYHIDPVFKDLKVISSIKFKNDKLNLSPFGLKNKMRKKKVRKLFPASWFSDNNDRGIIDYKGYSIDLRYKKKKLVSAYIERAANRRR